MHIGRMGAPYLSINFSRTCRFSVVHSYRILFHVLQKPPKNSLRIVRKPERKWSDILPFGRLYATNYAGLISYNIHYTSFWLLITLQNIKLCCVKLLFWVKLYKPLNCSSVRLNITSPLMLLIDPETFDNHTCLNEAYMLGKHINKLPVLMKACNLMRLKSRIISTSRIPFFRTSFCISTCSLNF